MSFTVPDFNLTCEIFTGPWLTKVLRVSAVPCNLAWGRRAGPALFALIPDVSANAVNANMTLLLPPGTDVRSFPLYGQADMVEVPSGSGRWYTVPFVDDIGKGFANEHRAAILAQISQHLDMPLFAGLEWPVPMP